jgi:hypothetical protein
MSFSTETVPDSEDDICLCAQNITSIILNPIQDAYVRGGVHSDTNFNSESVLVLKTTDNEDFNREIYLQFNISHQINKNYSSCYLSIREWDVLPYHPPFFYYIDSTISNTWDETEITWNNRPGSSEPSVGHIEINQGPQIINVSPIISNSKENLITFHIWASSDNDPFDKAEMPNRENFGCFLICSQTPCF